jgi:hypothetical protein
LLGTINTNVRFNSTVSKTDENAQSNPDRSEKKLSEMAFALFSGHRLLFYRNDELQQ